MGKQQTPAGKYKERALFSPCTQVLLKLQDHDLAKSIVVEPPSHNNSNSSSSTEKKTDVKPISFHSSGLDYISNG